MSHVTEINDPEELESLRLVWSALLPQTKRASFFHSLDWLQAYWQTSGAGQKLRVLVVEGDGSTIGILPLCVRIEAYKIGPVRILTYPLHDWGTFYSPIGPNPTATLTAGLRHIHETPRDWDLFDLRWIDCDRTDGDRTETALRQAGFTSHKEVWNEAGFVDLTMPESEWWESRPNKWRTNVGRNERRLGRLGELRYLRYRPLGEAHGDGDPRWDLYDTCVEIARQSWQGSSTTGTTLSHESVREYFRATHERAAKLGMLDVNLLYLNDQAISFTYNYYYQGEVQGIRLGYVPGSVNNGAGNILYCRSIRDSYVRGDTAYDLGVGSLSYKKEICTHTEKSYRLTHYPALAWKAQALRAKRAWKNWRSGGETAA